MKLLELEIQNMRGIRSLSLEPNGENLVIHGPNGSGKSAVVDAIDFLLTGRISRLAGRGTGGISLGRHGPHIDCKPENAIVRAIVQLPGADQSFEIKRCMASVGDLQCDSGAIQHLEPALILARRGQHVLTRREILKYVTAEASTRAEEIQELLNVADIEDVRKTLVRVQNDLKKDYQSEKAAVKRAKARIAATAQQRRFLEKAILQVVNQNRTVLGGQPISVLESAKLTIGIKPPTGVSPDRDAGATLVSQDIQNLLDVISEQSQEQVAENDKQLRAVLGSIRSDPRLLRDLSRLELITLGMELIDETGSCPLCETPWEPGKLYSFLDDRKRNAEIAGQQQIRINKLTETLAGSVNSAFVSVENIIKAAQAFGLTQEISTLQSWSDDLQELSDTLSDALEKYPVPRFEPDRVKCVLAPGDVVEFLKSLQSTITEKIPEKTPEQMAWETLIRFDENLEVLEGAQRDLDLAALSFQRAIKMLEKFLNARDTILGKLYDDIRDRFIGLYKELHGSDEKDFIAIIEPEGAGLRFEVDFHGRGTHPPHALHSEGHQDSMGLCLYLALAEQLTGGIIDLIILDDVVMSVDHDHRRELCRLLANSFPGRQFLITTHDKTWANQLKSDGIVRSRSIIEFYNWDVDTGPKVNYQAEMWQRIEKYLQENNVPDASAQLRRGSEQFFSMVCDALKSQVTYNLNNRWTLGDFLPAAMAQYRKLLARAKEAAQSWGDHDTFKILTEAGSTASQVFVRSQAEQWAANVNVHYNAWANFSEKDFRPLVEAFQDLYHVFICSQCGGMLYLTTREMQQVAVRCNCGYVNWNLVKKRKKN